MRTVLICHAEDAFDRQALAAWLASFSTLAGIVVLSETAAQKRQRYRRELRRVGWLGFLDVLAMRVYHRLFLATSENRALAGVVDATVQRYGPVPAVPELHVASGNDKRVVTFLKQAAPDIVLARCKQLLSKKVFSIARAGTFVMHPGICPEYRNAHGCFWALARRDLDRVGMTLLRIDPGIDTGPVFGYYRYAFDERREGYHLIQCRVVADNLDVIAGRLAAIHDGSAETIDTEGRDSGVWGQPRLTTWWRWQRALAREARD